MELLKIKAKDVLRYSYWMSLAATFIFTLLYGACTGALSMFYSSLSGISYMDGVTDLSPAAVIGMIAQSSVFLIIGLAATIFAGIPLWVGHNSFYIKAANNDVNLMSLFDGFKYKYLNIVKIMFLYGLYINLWALLVFVPIIAVKMCFPNISDFVLALLAIAASAVPIIKQLQYFMIEYIIADNPEITAKRAFEITKAATNGYKLKIFLFQLSFIGWMLLGVIACYIGTYFVMPYFYASRVQCYLFLKENAIAGGIASHADFNTDALRGYIL